MLKKHVLNFVYGLGSAISVDKSTKRPAKKSLGKRAKLSKLIQVKPGASIVNLDPPSVSPMNVEVQEQESLSQEAEISGNTDSSCKLSKAKT